MTPKFENEEAKDFYQTCMDALEVETKNISDAIESIHKKGSPEWTSAVFELAKFRMGHQRDSAHKAFQLDHEIFLADREAGVLPVTSFVAPGSGEIS
jgi:hypothetical protein